MRPIVLPALVVAACATLLAAGEARALTLLTAGKRATFLDAPGTARDAARIEVRDDDRLASLPDPRDCAAPFAIEISSYPMAKSLVVDSLSLPLPCSGWRATALGYRHVDRVAGVDVRVSRRGLSIRARGPAYRAVQGPVGYVEAWLSAGDRRWLVRFHQFTRNDARAVVARRTTRLAAAGEAAFWDMLWGDAPRERDAIELLTRAAAADRGDGRSRFLLGMTHLFRFGNAVGDLHRPSAAAKRDVTAANRAFAAAAPLLWDGRKGDSRVPGFAAAARYTGGIAFADAGEVEAGLADLEAAYEANPLFNSFDLIGVVPPAVAPDDPLYGRALEILDAALSGQVGACVAGQDEICGNAGMAPHNGEGAFILFGDIYAKGGRARDAGTWYDAAVALGSGSGWKFTELARDRAASVDQRVAAYRDGDPGNDPPIIGSGPGACSYCHAR